MEQLGNQSVKRSTGAPRRTEGQRTLGSYNMPGEVTFQMKFVFEPSKGYLKNRMRCVKGEGERIAGEIPLP